MDNKKFFYIHLPKWSGMIVMGEKVSKEQAISINLETNSLTLCTNESKFEKDYYDLVYGFDIEDYKNYTDYMSGKLKPCIFIDRIDGLDYLNNNNIASAWIGGPHGWCDWDGNIFCNTFNIGKYPTVGNVYAEWCLIAKRYPYLDLRCQLFNGETCSEDIKPVIEFIVKGGNVEMCVPDKKLSDFEEFEFTLFTNGGEIGCDIPTLKEYLEIYKNTKNP